MSTAIIFCPRPWKERLDLISPFGKYWLVSLKQKSQLIQENVPTAFVDGMEETESLMTERGQALCLLVALCQSLPAWMSG